MLSWILTNLAELPSADCYLAIVGTHSEYEARKDISMAQIKNEAAYRAALKRIDELLKVVNDSTPDDDPSYLELDMISDMVAEYEEIHYPIS